MKLPLDMWRNVPGIGQQSNSMDTVGENELAGFTGIMGDSDRFYSNTADGKRLVGAETFYRLKTPSFLQILVKALESRVPAVMKTGISKRRTKGKTPPIWSECSWVTRTALISEGKRSRRSNLCTVSLTEKTQINKETGISILNQCTVTATATAKRRHLHVTSNTP